MTNKSSQEVSMPEWFENELSAVANMSFDEGNKRDFISGAEWAYAVLSQQKAAPGNDIIDAIRRHTDELIAKGPKACRKFLEDTGIIEEDAHTEAHPIADSKSPGDGCGDCEIEYVRHGAREMQAFQTKENNDLKAELSEKNFTIENLNGIIKAQAIKIEGLEAAFRERGEMWERAEKELRYYRKALVDIAHKGNILDDTISIAYDVLNKYPLPTPINKDSNG